MNEFDLMKEKPVLDIPTLNFIWDMLKRSNLCNQRKNVKQRVEYYNQESIMKDLEYYADKENENIK